MPSTIRRQIFLDHGHVQIDLHDASADESQAALTAI
jgi:hypothetical protein